MRLQARRLTRRCFLAGVGAAVGDFGTPSHARAQTASEAFRLVRPHPAGASASGAGAALRYDASLPGPTLRARRGEELRVRLVNALAEPLDPAGAPLFAARRGRAVTLAIRNTSGHPWVVHVHGHSFRLLDRLDDGWKPYWVDTLLVGEQTERIAFVADNPGKWLIDCRMLERRDADARTWFVVS